MTMLATAAVAGAMPDQSRGVPELSTPRPGAGMLLIANRGLRDPNFSRAVVLLTRYDENGTTGLILNRPLQLAAADALPPLSGLPLDSGRLHWGGPVSVNSLQILLRSDSPPAPARHVFGDVYLVGDASVLEDLQQGRTGGSALRLYAGYAGWSSGQLENELLRGDWYLRPANAATVFTAAPGALWRDLIERASARWARAGAGGRAADERALRQYNSRPAGLSAAPMGPEGRHGNRVRGQGRPAAVPFPAHMCAPLQTPYIPVTPAC